MVISCIWNYLIGNFPFDLLKEKITSTSHLLQPTPSHKIYIQLDQLPKPGYVSSICATAQLSTNWLSLCVHQRKVKGLDAAAGGASVVQQVRPLFPRWLKFMEIVRHDRKSLEHPRGKINVLTLSSCWSINYQLLTCLIFHSRWHYKEFLSQFTLQLLVLKICYCAYEGYFNLIWFFYYLLEYEY